MKQKYILGIYDKLIDEIKHYKKTNDSEIIAYLKDCANESHYFYKIKFSKQQGKIKFAHQKRVHNLHPYAPDFINSDCDINPEFENLIPIILKELNIPDSNLEFCWTDQNNQTILIIKEPCKIEELLPEIRFFLYCYLIVKNENYKIKITHKERFFSLKSKDDLELYIHRKQQALENLHQSLIKEICPIDPREIYKFSSDYNKIDCLKITYIYIEKLLLFIEKEYQNFLNVNIQVPYRTLLVKEIEIEEKLIFVKSRLLDSNIIKKLFQLAYLPIHKIATINIQEKITYNEFYYCIEFISKLYDVLQQKKDDISDSDIIGWLFDLNFNSIEFFDYKTDEINKKLDLLESNNQKIDALYQLLKGYNQRQGDYIKKFHKRHPSIKEQIVNWIEEEIEYLSKKIKLGENIRHDEMPSKPRVKIQTNMSVAHFSYFNKLLMQAKALSHDNNSEFFKFIADNYKTKLTENISADSVKTKYHNVEESTIIATRQLLIKLYNLAK